MNNQVIKNYYTVIKNKLIHITTSGKSKRSKKSLPDPYEYQSEA